MSARGAHGTRGGVSSLLPGGGRSSHAAAAPSPAAASSGNSGTGGVGWEPGRPVICRFNRLLWESNPGPESRLRFGLGVGAGAGLQLKDPPHTHTRAPQTSPSPPTLGRLLEGGPPHLLSPCPEVASRASCTVSSQAGPRRPVQHPQSRGRERVTKDPSPLARAQPVPSPVTVPVWGAPLPGLGVSRRPLRPRPLPARPAPWLTAGSGPEGRRRPLSRSVSPPTAKVTSERAGRVSCPRPPAPDSGAAS